MKKKVYLIVFALCLFVLSTGCAHKNLVFTTYTKVGLGASAVNGVPVDLEFGYNRFEGTIIPMGKLEEKGEAAEQPEATEQQLSAKEETAAAKLTKNPPEVADNSAGNKQKEVTSSTAKKSDKSAKYVDEAPSVFASIDINNKWFGGLTVVQVFATGEAAINAAEDSQGFANIVGNLKARAQNPE